MVKIKEKWILHFGIHVFSKFVFANCDWACLIAPDVRLLQVQPGNALR
jgi:hypothetical protein